MAIIDPDGLFCGERLAACSDLAKLYWPRFFLASNGYGRLELSYKSLVSRVFGNFQKIPESSEIWEIFREYEANFLAVLYESSDGCWWCQFITSEKYLPKYKKTRDNDSPAPTFEQMEKSRTGYLAWKKANSFSNQSFQKVSESFVRRGEERRGFGIGAEGSGEEEKDLPRSGGGNGRAPDAAPAPPFIWPDPEQAPPSPAAYGFSDLKDDATMVARAVTEHFKFSSQWDYEGIRSAAELQLRENVPKDELTESMIAAWEAYTQRIKEGKHRTGIRRKPQDFFGDGTWANWRLWGLKKGFKGYEKTDKENAPQWN